MEIIQKALQIKDLDYIKLAKLIGFNAIQIQFAKIFWQPDMNNSWFYVGKEMVIDWFGSASGKDTMQRFYTNLIKNYEEYEDYKEVDKNDDLVKKFYSQKPENEKLGNRAKYYIITGECLKGLLMSANTVKGKEIRRYFIKVEKLSQLMIKVFKEKDILKFKNEIEEKERQLQTAESKNLKLTTKIKDITVLKINGFIYISTTRQYSQNNQYKIGKTIKLDSRISTYQSGRAKGDEMYYVFIFESEEIDTLELLIRKLLIQFRDTKTKDMYVLQYNLLKKYMHNICNLFRNDCIGKLNELIINNIECKTHEEIPEPFDFINKEYNTDDKIVTVYRRSSKLKSEEELLTIFLAWFHDTYKYTKDDKQYISMSTIFNDYKNSTIYGNLRVSEKYVVTKKLMLDTLLKDSKLESLFKKTARTFNGAKFCSTFINYTTPRSSMISVRMVT